MKNLVCILALVVLVAFAAPAIACPPQQLVGSCGVQQFAVMPQAFVAPQYVQQVQAFSAVPQFQVNVAQPQLIVRQRVVQQVVRPQRVRISVRSGGLF